MNTLLYVLQVCYDCECHDDQQRPRTPLSNMDRRPRTKLIWVLPDVEEGADILGQPDEESDQYERQQQQHLSLAVQWTKHDRGSCIEPKHAGGKVPAVVADVVMSEEVGVDDEGSQSSGMLLTLGCFLKVQQKINIFQHPAPYRR